VQVVDELGQPIDSSSRTSTVAVVAFDPAGAASTDRAAREPASTSAALPSNPRRVTLC